MTMELTHVRLLVRNFGECFNFYSKVLEMECSYGSETDVYADFNMNGTKVALFIRKGMAETVNKANLPEHAEMQDRVALVFKVDSVDATYDSLRLKGIEFVNTPTDRPDWGIRTAHFRDPDGNLLEIYTDLGND